VEGCLGNGALNKNKIEGGAVAEWSKALLKSEKTNENQNIPGSPPGLGTFKKNTNKIV
jgi:hypothetical protein